MENFDIGVVQAVKKIVRHQHWRYDFEVLSLRLFCDSLMFCHRCSSHVLLSLSGVLEKASIERRFNSTDLWLTRTGCALPGDPGR